MLFTITALVFIVCTGYVGTRLASLADDIAEAITVRRKRALVRQVGAILGWWLIALGIAGGLADQAPMPMMFVPLGLTLVGLAIASKIRGDIPMFRGAP